jgi:phosphoenolpyruvate carboxykinase (GTP)
METPLGWMPQYEDIDWRGLKFSKDQFHRLVSIDREEWIQEVAAHNELFYKLYDRLPRELPSIGQLVLSGLWRAETLEE